MFLYTEAMNTAGSDKRKCCRPYIIIAHGGTKETVHLRTDRWLHGQNVAVHHCGGSTWLHQPCLWL